MAGHKSGLLAAVLATIALGLGGCDDEPEPATWDRVQQIFVDHGCAEGTCHNDDAFQGELSLAGADAIDELVGVPCANKNADDSGMFRIAPGDPDASFLLTKVTMGTADAVLGMPMPPVGEALSDQEIDILERWIDAGATR